MAGARVLVLADSGPRVGGGHVMRCLTLAQALTARGADCAFAATAPTQTILTAFAPPGLTVIPLTDDGDPVSQAVAAATAFKADWVLLDHYGLNAAQESALRGGRRLAALDDLADRPRAADLIANCGFGAAAADYQGLVPRGATVLCGPAHALVRPEFAARRAAALARRREGGPVRHVLIALGLTDVDGITARVVQAVRPLLDGMILDVVLGSEAPSLPALRDAAKGDPRLRLHIDTRAMADLTAAADLAIGAGGSSVWERCTLGLPTATVILADNQRPMAQAMAAADLTLAVDAAAMDVEARLTAAAGRLRDDAALRRSLSETSAAACDGLGAARVAEALLA